jgi:hypothetical protein
MNAALDRVTLCTRRFVRPGKGAWRQGRPNGRASDGVASEQPGVATTSRDTRTGQVWPRAP